MKLSSTIIVCTMTLSMVGCAGRTAYWEAKPSGEGTGDTAQAVTVEPADAAWAGRAEEAKVREVEENVAPQWPIEFNGNTERSGPVA